MQKSGLGNWSNSRSLVVIKHLSYDTTSCITPLVTTVMTDLAIGTPFCQTFPRDQVGDTGFYMADVRTDAHTKLIFTAVEDGPVITCDHDQGRLANRCGTNGYYFVELKFPIEKVISEHYSYTYTIYLTK